MLDVNSFKISPMGDSAIIINFSDTINIHTHIKIKSLCGYLDKYPFEGIIEYVPAFVTLTIFYDPLVVIKSVRDKTIQQYKSPFHIVETLIKGILSKLEDSITDKPRTIEVPVCYGGEFGPDLNFVAEYNNLSIEEVIHIHCNSKNRVYMIGFSPGFPYLAGMSNKIATPRKESPRLCIPEGSVGIAGSQTGVYPISTPGGWQLIGKTPLKLFNPENEIPTLLMAGDIVKFTSISQETYFELKQLK